MPLPMPVMGNVWASCMLSLCAGISDQLARLVNCESMVTSTCLSTLRVAETHAGLQREVGLGKPWNQPKALSPGTPPHTGLPVPRADTGQALGQWKKVGAVWKEGGERGYRP